tara:strand:- start:23655 stop:23918 length:264 start_codon:yes stop_codon:yes gene_type:complete
MTTIPTKEVIKANIERFNERGGDEVTRQAITSIIQSYYSHGGDLTDLPLLCDAQIAVLAIIGMTTAAKIATEFNSRTSNACKDLTIC